MHLVLDYSILGSTPGRRRAALTLLVSVVNHPLGKVWTPASNWAKSDLQELLKRTGLADGVLWKENVPFLVKSWDGYVLTNSDLLVQDLMQFEPSPMASDALPPFEYSGQVKAAVLAGFGLWQETAAFDKE